MAFDKYKKKKAGDRLSVGFINRLASAARTATTPAPGSFQNQRAGGSASGITQPPPHFQVLVEITNERINSSDKRTSGLYLCKILYSTENSNSSSPDDVLWKTIDKEWELDATATKTLLEKGGRLTAYWHQQRGMFIPVVNEVPPIYFKLQKVLNEKATVKAWVLFWDVKSNSFKNPKEDTINVTDFRLEGFEAPKGTNGVAFARSGSNGTVYEIVELFWNARFIEFQLTTDLTTKDRRAKASVVRYWMGKNPAPSDEKINVYNSLLSNNLYEFEGQGTDASYPSKGFAVYDEHDNIYRIWVMEHQGRDLSAKAQKDWEENNGEPRVSVKRSNDDGTNERGDAFFVALPRNRDVKNDFDPAVYKDDVIRWNLTNEGNIECKSTYLTSKIGDLKWQKGTTRIETGWRLTDGEDEAWDVKGRVLMAYDPDDEAEDGSETIPGSDVGFRKHGVTENNHDTHTTEEVAAALDNHDPHADDDVAAAIADHTAVQVVGAIADHVLDNNHAETSAAAPFAAGSDLDLLSHSDLTHDAELFSDLQHVGAAGDNSLEHSEHAGTGDPDDNLDHSDSDNRQPSRIAVLVERFK